MRFGLTLTPYTPADRYGMREVVQIAKVAQAAGFRSVVQGESYATYPICVPPVVPTLARLAADLGPEMRYIIGVSLLPLHNPVELAENVAILDQICYGNTVFGVGLAWRKNSMEAFGCPESERLTRFTNHLTIIRQLWKGEPVDFESSYCVLKGARSAVLPLQPSGPPVWIGGSKDAVVRRAARLGDGWYMNPNAKRQTLERQRGIYLAELAAKDRPTPAELPIRREVFMQLDGDHAMKEAERYLMPLYSNLIKHGHGEQLPDDDTLDPDFEILRRDRFIIGNPREIVDEMAVYEKSLGATEMIVRIGWPGMDATEVCRRVTAFGDHVIAAMN
jgi:alkanesulfonate monooxygenase SsuD/methylene tetrahydromethanopterin reductase-like flavin-dependent oxidoreductase (luciferase family)